MHQPKNKNELIKLIAEKIKLDKIDTSLITDMSNLFKGSKLKKFDGIETWDVSNVVNMESMFEGASDFNHNIESWDVSKVENMSYMFKKCKKFNSPLNDWNVSSVVNMEGMLSNCESFNQNLESWKLGENVSMKYAFIDSPIENNPPSWYKS